MPKYESKVSFTSLFKVNVLMIKLVSKFNEDKANKMLDNMFNRLNRNHKAFLKIRAQRVS